MAGYGQRAQLLQCIVSCLLLPHLIHGAIAGGDVGGGSVDLSYGYYKDLCPELEVIVRNALLPIFMTDPRSPSAFLRLLFHDCQVQGCDASILLDYDYSQGTSEMASSKNFGIRNRESISEIKSVVEQVCPRQVSCADILALAARDSVAYSGGPYIAIPLSRKDSTTSSIHRADEELPSASLGSDGALRLFANKGMTIEEAVAIMGGHTLGTGHCINIVHRLYDSEDVQHEKSMESGFEALLRLKCPTQVPLTNHTFVVNDLTTLVFDNQYYRNVVDGRGLFTVDAAIHDGPGMMEVEMEEDAGGILGKISSLKEILDKVNEEIVEAVGSTREMEDEIAKCSEMERRCLSRERDLTNMISLAEFDLNGLTQVAAVGETSLELLEKELRIMEMNMNEIQGRISAKREEFITQCDTFQNDILNGGTELNALLSEKEALENERQNLNMKISALQNSTKEYLEELLEEIHSFTSALETEVEHKNSERLELLKDISELKLLFCSISPPEASAMSV